MSFSREIYLDNNATTQPLPQVLEAVTAAMTHSFGNPSRVHQGGERSRRLLRQSREAVADLIGASADALFFT
jgi:cysteine desulfurase